LHPAKVFHLFFDKDENKEYIEHPIEKRDTKTQKQFEAPGPELICISPFYAAGYSSSELHPTQLPTQLPSSGMP